MEQRRGTDPTKKGPPKQNQPPKQDPPKQDPPKEDHPPPKQEPPPQKGKPTPVTSKEKWHKQRILMLLAWIAASFLVIFLILCILFVIGFFFKYQDVRSTETLAFEKVCARAHNKYRKIHGVPNIVIETQISLEAQDWADEIAEKMVNLYKDENDWGKNLYIANGLYDLNCEHAIDAWYRQGKDYNYNFDKKLSRDHAAFTQVIWKSSTKLGCGSARNGNLTYVVCFYHVYGNFESAEEVAFNILPPQK